MPPADPSTYCPVCGYAWQVRGCTKEKCRDNPTRNDLIELAVQLDCALKYGPALRVLDVQPSRKNPTLISPSRRVRR